MERLKTAPPPDRRFPQALSEAPSLFNGHSLHDPQPEPVYNTGMGALTFEQIYAKTSRTVGYLMREVHGMTNPEDIDDCMQSGYLKLWQQLQKDPACFADKPKRYIVQAVLFRSKSQRFSHQRHYGKLVYDADAEGQRSASLMTTDQVDTWIDLAQALEHVAREVEDTPAELLGFYCLITQATMQDVAATFGMGYSTLSAKKRQVKADLAAALPGYGLRPANGNTAPPQPQTSAGLVTTRLLEAVNGTSERVIYQAAAYSPNQYRVAFNGHYKPPETNIATEPAYPTGWGRSLSLEQIITDPVVCRAAFAKAARLGLAETDQQDCVQQGFIRLWQKLQAEPTLLADKGPLWVGIYVAYSGNAKQFQRHNTRQQVFSDPAFDWRDADEYLRLGLLTDKRPTHARWTAEVDESLDVRRFLKAMRQHYADNPRKLVALQAVTGAISAKEAARQLGMHEKNFAAGIGNRVRREVQALLPDNFKEAQPRSWQVPLARGEWLEHIAAVAQEVMHDQRLLLALYVVTTSASKKEVAKTFGYGLTAFGKDIRKIKQMLAARYHRWHSIAADDRTAL